MEEIPLEDDVRDSIEYKILMAYAQRRLSATKYEKLLKNEAKRQKSSSLIKRKVEMIDHQREKDGPRQVAVSQGGMMEQQSKEQPRRRYWPGYCLPFLCGRAEQEKPPVPPLQQGHMAHCFVFEAQSERLQEGSSQHQTNATLKKTLHAPCQEQDDSNPTDGKEGQEHDEEKIIQTIVSLLRQSGDQLEEKIKNDRAFYQHFKGMLSYTFFKRITDLFLEDISADSTSEPGEQVQCTKVALTMEVATRLTTVDNHPMNVVLGFGSMYLREHFKPWIQDQGGWEKALNSLDQEEVE
ncbi:Apoptosis facilitator Bcl-2-like 14 [Eurypyga helias]|uniref:Apoptosis facilitator Bcl-2-like 14 n=1 Tax=Eurypyga helias TaxID=54383 RepID=A0A093J6K7_EURHL|nr:Apoptosis facilitator Bcl-2-like 14 [Eurypyga helias]